MVKQFLKERLGTIIFFAIVVILVLWGVLSISNARGSVERSYNENYKAPEDTADLSQPGSYKSIAKTDSLELFYNETKGSIQVKDLKSGYLWRSILDEETFDLSDFNNRWRNTLSSPIGIVYNDMKKRDTAARTVYTAGDCKALTTEYIDNGVSVEYGFTSAGIYVTIEYVLEDDQLVVRVPYEKIRQEFKYAITTIEVLPFLGASEGNEDGYLFYPDGSGAITTYAKVNTRPSNVLKASYYAYTNKTVNFMNLWSDDEYEHYTASMPVFGIKNGKNALFGYVTEGAANSGVEVYPSGANLMDLNHAGILLYTRNVFEANASSVSVLGSRNNSSKVYRVDKNLIQENKEVRYSFLSGDNANYSGMAAVYRAHLLESGQLKQADNMNSEMPLALQLLMGTEKYGMVFKEYIPMTTYGQVQEILESLSAKGVSDTELVLKAWQDGYANYEPWGPASRLGGGSGLRDLHEYLQAHSGVHAYLEVDTTDATSKTKGLNENADVLYNGLNVQVAASASDGMTYYLLNPLASFERNERLLRELKNYSGYGVAYETAGLYAYPDYNVNRADGTFTKSQTVEKLRQMLSATETDGRGVAVNGANQYVYGSADYLYNLREQSYGLSITDYSVPFVQMVVSGLIPYSTEGAGNLSYDLQQQKLKWIETGSIPSFYLTYESALKLRDTDYDTLFSSTFADWESTVVDTYREFKENLSCVYGQQMVGHNYLTDDLIRLDYANGVRVYVNYGSEEAAGDGVRVPAKDYLVVGGER